MANIKPGNIKPSDIGGHGRKAGDHGGLVEEFASFCPPDIQPNTRVLGLIGVSDYAGKASPNHDGWFFSDGFAWMWLLANTPDFKTAFQIWMMCESPRDLVNKYGRYLHGDPEHNHPEKRVDRKIVLDSEMLPAIEAAGNLRVVPPQHLLQRFLDTLRSESKLAKKNGETLLILIFGHGDKNSYGISVGGKTTRDAPRLTRVDFHNHLEPGVEATLIITSCYSAGWLTQPRAGSYYAGTAPMFNMTGIAGAGVTRKSRSLPKSASIGRQAAGSYLVKSIINGLMAVSEVAPPPNSPSPDLTVQTMKARVTVDDDGEDISNSPTYAALVKAVYDELVHVVDPFNWDCHKFSFAAQDDLWETDWRKRTGLPLIKYKERWDQLRSVPTGPTMDSQTLLPRPPQYQTGGGPVLSDRQRGILMAKAICYMNSNPGDAEDASNSCHSDFEAFLSGEQEYDDEDLLHFSNVLDYRAKLMQETAQIYTFCLGLPSPVPAGIDTMAWFREKTTKAKRNDHPDQKKCAELLKRWNAAHELIEGKVQLFDTPTREQGQPYSKPVEYLCMLLAESNLTEKEMEDRLNELRMNLLNMQVFLAKSEPATKIIESRSVRNAHKTLKGTLKGFRQRMRSLSPFKERARDSPS